MSGFILLIPIAVIIFGVLYLRSKEKKPFKAINASLNFGMQSMINSLKVVSDGKLKKGFWEDPFFISFAYSVLLAAIREFSKREEFYFTESEENEMILKAFSALKGKSFVIKLEDTISERSQNYVDGLLAGVEYTSYIYKDKNKDLATDYLMDKVLPRYE